MSSTAKPRAPFTHVPGDEMTDDEWTFDFFPRVAIQVCGRTRLQVTSTSGEGASFGITFHGKPHKTLPLAAAAARQVARDLGWDGRPVVPA